MIFELKTKISSIKQGGLSVTEYYNWMNGSCLELNHYQSIKMVCSVDPATLSQILERDRVVEFIVGLNS